MNKCGTRIHRNITDEEWLAICAKSASATFFHTPYWAGIFTERFPGRYRKKAYSIECDAVGEVLVPMVTKRHLFGLVTVSCSMPGGTFGGPVFTSPLNSKHVAVVNDLLGEPENLILRENPYEPLLGSISGATVTDDPTQTVDCSGGYDAVWQCATAAHRNAVRNATKAGVEVSIAVKSDEWDAYSLLYEASICRWKKRSIFSGVSYDRSFFKLIEKLDPSHRRLFVAKAKGTVIAGILCFYWNSHAVVWHGAGSEEHFRLHPNNLLYDRALFHAVDNGFRWFDCNPSGNLSGVYKFKHYFGARPLSSRVFIKRSALTTSLDVVRKRIKGAA